MSVGCPYWPGRLGYHSLFGDMDDRLRQNPDNLLFHMITSRLTRKKREKSNQGRGRRCILSGWLARAFSHRGALKTNKRHVLCFLFFSGFFPPVWPAH